MQTFSQRVLAWFDIHGRKHLPWQQSVTPYSTWVSEIMLQQTQVATVIPYYHRFMHRFPDVITLANANIDNVLAHWAGLGYYSRARNLHKAAQIIRDKHHGLFPEAFDDVMALPGIGQSTAGAILSLSLGQRHAILDGNVKRVLSRHQLIDGIPNHSQTLKKQWAIAEHFTPQQDCNKYTQAMMDLGATICTRRNPKCDDCPVHSDCGARQMQKIDDYPNKKPKKQLPERHTIMLIITDGERVYLEKRPDGGIWGGLWSLPEVGNQQQTNDNIINDNTGNDNVGVNNPEISSFLAKQQLRATKYQQRAIYKHTFTHYHLFIHPILTRVESLPKGFTPDDYQQLGLPAPVKRLLSAIF